MCNSYELIHIGTEQLRNERMNIYFPHGIFISLLHAFFVTNLANSCITPPFRIKSCSNLNQY